MGARRVQCRGCSRYEYTPGTGSRISSLMGCTKERVYAYPRNPCKKVWRFPDIQIKNQYACPRNRVSGECLYQGCTNNNLNDCPPLLSGPTLRGPVTAEQGESPFS